MRRLLTAGTVFSIVVLGPPLAAAAQAHQAQTQEKPQEPKTPATPAGKWDVSLQTEQGAFPSTLELKVEEKKVSGTMASERGTTAVEGEYADGKLTFWLTVQGSNGSVTVNFSGSMQQDGSLSGTADAQGYQMSWKATRAKSV